MTNPGKAGVDAPRAAEITRELLSTVSHELRTPLNAVIGFSELLLDEASPKLDATQARYVADILKGGRRLGALITDLLDLVKLECGRMSLSLEPIDGTEVVSEAQLLFEGTAREKDVAIQATIGSSRPALADRVKLRQIVMTLLGNALDVTPAGSFVELGVEDEERFVRFWVRDRGPGMDGELMARAFAPFAPRQTRPFKKQAGTGLGLALSKGLVEAHGGTIEVTNHPGGGSTFSFTVIAAGQTAVDFTRAGEDPSARANDVDPVEAAPASVRREDRLVLVVDDHELNRELVRAILERKGYRVLVAADGSEGVAIARREAPALVLMDLEMPRTDGFTALRELRADPSTKAIPIVALTACSARSDDRRVREAGFDGHLAKPLDREALEATVARLAGSRTRT